MNYGRINVTLPKQLTRAIDRHRRNRSRFLAEAAAEKLSREHAAAVIFRSAGVAKGKVKSGRAVVNALRSEERKRLSTIMR